MLIETLTLEKEDITLAPYAKRFVETFEKSTQFLKEKQKIFNEFKKKILYQKITYFGYNVKTNSFSHELFKLNNMMQERRLINLKNNKITFIINKLGEVLDYDSSEEKFEFYYNLAKEQLQEEIREEKIIFIKEKIRELQIPLFIENYNTLSDERINRHYIYICGFLNINLKTTKRTVYISDVIRNIQRGKVKARLKSIHNFYQEKKLSFLTLTLPMNNADGSLSKEVLDLNTIQPISILFMKKLRQEIRSYLKTKLNYSKIQIKVFMKCFFKSLKVTQITKNKVIHFHFLFNIDLLKMFGCDNRVMFQDNSPFFNTEFYQNPQYYIDNIDKYNAKNGWHFQQRNNLFVPIVFKWWADIVSEELPNLKKLNPRSQNLQVFIKGGNYNGLTLKNEIKECFLRESALNVDFADLVSNYVTKYASGLSVKEMTKMIVKNNRIFTGKRLFQFSLSCKNCPVEKQIIYVPFDLKIEGKEMTGFYFNDILEFEDKQDKREHILSFLIKNNIMKFNGEERIKTERGLEFFNKNKISLTKKYKQIFGKIATFYFTSYYSSKPFNTAKAHKKYILFLERLNHIFDLNKLEKYKKTETNYEKINCYTDFHNYKDPLTPRLLN